MAKLPLLNRWYPIISYPLEVAAECILECACCKDHHIGVWMPAPYLGTRGKVLCFVMGRYGQHSADPELKARSEFGRFKVIAYLPQIEIDPATPLLDPSMYLHAAELAAWAKGERGDPTDRVIN